MAKNYYKAPKHSTGHAVTTKTHFGSTVDMVVDHNALSLEIPDSSVVCKDDIGYYITNKAMIDSGLADPNRYANAKSRIVVSETTKQENSSS
ncbi:hypothetical protein EB077_12895 [bacterium]|nr:hypothetical protein [bacterium]